MTNKELKEWFIYKWNSCYAVVHDDFPDSIFLYYDESVVRKMKLCKLNNIEFKMDKITGICLFEQDYNNKDLWCDYREIWSFFEDNYSYSKPYITKFIKNILKEKGKLSKVTPFLGNIREMSLTPIVGNTQDISALKEKAKLTILTPRTFIV